MSERFYQVVKSPAGSLVILLAVNALVGFEEAVLLGIVFILGRMELDS